MDAQPVLLFSVGCGADDKDVIWEVRRRRVEEGLRDDGHKIAPDMYPRPTPNMRRQWRAAARGIDLASPAMHGLTPGVEAR